MAKVSEALWLSRTAAAALTGLSSRQFDEAVRPLMAADGERGTGKTLRLHGAKVVAAFLEYRLAQLKPAEVDPMMGAAAVGFDSPALEEYRRYRAGQECIKLALLAQTAIPRDQLEPALAQFAGVLRSATQQLQRRFGAEAAAIVNEAIDDAEAGWIQTLANVPPLGQPTQPDAGRAPPDGGAGPGAKAPVDPAVR